MLDIDETIDNQVNEAVSFIQEALKSEPSYIEVESGDEETEPLLLNKDLDELSFHTIAEKEPKGKKESSGWLFLRRPPAFLDPLRRSLHIQHAQVPERHRQESHSPLLISRGML